MNAYLRAILIFPVICFLAFTGRMRIEETARLFDLVGNYIRQTIPASEMEKLRNPGGLMPLPESRYGY